MGQGNPMKLYSQFALDSRQNAYNDPLDPLFQSPQNPSLILENVLSIDYLASKHGDAPFLLVIDSAVFTSE